MKVVMILFDGMRPDALKNVVEVLKMKEKSTYSMCARTVFPSVTLPCHMSLFHSVDPMRHGVTTNVYTPQVRPIKGLCELLTDRGMKCDMYYTWSELQDIARPGALNYAYFLNGHSDIDQYQLNDRVTENAIANIKEFGAEFSFVYFGMPDTIGHKYGWMGKEYDSAIRYCWKNATKLMDTLDEEYAVIILADHGGHDRMHGTEEDTDMTIPVFIKGKGIKEGNEIDGVRIIDVAPTICKLLGVESNIEWEGEALV